MATAEHEAETIDCYSKDVLLTVGLYNNVDDAESQDAILHRIFASIVEEVLQGDLGAKQITEAIVTLYRLYFSDGWEAARPFFYMLSGQLLNKDEPKCDITDAYTDTLFAHLTEPVQIPILDPRTISGECDKHADLLTALWFDSDSYYDRDAEDGSDEEGSDEEEEESGESDVPDDDESVASVGTDDGVGDPRQAAKPQWKE